MKTDVLNKRQKSVPLASFLAHVELVIEFIAVLAVKHQSLTRMHMCRNTEDFVGSEGMSLCQKNVAIKLFILLCFYAIPLGVGSVSNSCMGSSVRCQAPTDTTNGRRRGEEVGHTVDTCLCRRSDIAMFWQ